jgi:hypothetical protein
VNWNATFWGKECEVFTRRGGEDVDGGEPEAGDRTFTLNVTDERPSNSTENRHSYTVFRVDDSFRYIAGAYNANVGGTTIYGMDWNINFTNYRGGTFFFVTQQETFGPLSIQMGQSLFPEGSEVWVEAPSKKTNFTFTEDESNSRPPNFRFIDSRLAITTDLFLSGFLKGPHSPVGARGSGYMGMPMRWAKGLTDSLVPANQGAVRGHLVYV